MEHGYNETHWDDKRLFAISVNSLYSCSVSRNTWKWDGKNNSL